MGSWGSVLLLVSLSLGVSTRPPRDILLQEGHTSHTAEVGRRLVVDCGAPHNETLTWFKDGYYLNSVSPVSPRKGMTISNQRLKIRNVSLKDKGEYGCLSSSGLWYNMSLSVHELMPEGDKPALPILSSKRDFDDDGINLLSLEEDSGRPPMFTNSVAMHNMVATLHGTNYTLTCAADGSPLPDVTWYKDGRQLSAATWNLTVKVTESANYTCIVSNPLGTISHTVQLQAYRDKKDMPIIVETPSNTTVNAGDTTWLICKVSSMDDSQIVWLRHSNVHPSRLNTSDPDLRYINKADRYDPQRLMLENLRSSMTVHIY